MYVAVFYITCVFVTELLIFIPLNGQISRVLAAVIDPDQLRYDVFITMALDVGDDMISAMLDARRRTFYGALRICVGLNVRLRLTTGMLTIANYSDVNR